MPVSNFSRPGLTAQGFVGWIPFCEVLNRTNLPVAGGVYAVGLSAAEAPIFGDRSYAGRFKGKDPTVTRDVLGSNWVDGAEIIYIGKSDSLKRRLREFTKFGQGQPIGHWGGRLIWQNCRAVACCRLAGDD